MNESRQVNHKKIHGNNKVKLTTTKSDWMCCFLTRSEQHKFHIFY
ncbi:hypothetical protein T636_A0017 [Enterobacter hormaechei subsp. xiangfangensis]|nr:hypothetical protein T636_A0017 [Enterobacter hormaechei subsp. xiangfangensis]